jgi:intron-binding protein aquarius
VRLGVPAVVLRAQGRARASLARLYSWRYDGLQDLPHVAGGAGAAAAAQQLPEYAAANAGFAVDHQLVDVGDYEGAGESTPAPHFYQNLGEAEFVVAVFQYMRLLGVPADRIALLTTYNGQKALLRDVVRRRCAAYPQLFGEPARIETVDKFQGQQADFVLLSLVRTRAVGHLRDARRLVVALSRARLGLYVFCRQALFAGCFEAREAFALLARRPAQLQLLLGEQHPTPRRADEDARRAAEASGGLLHLVSVAGGPEQMGAIVASIMSAQRATAAVAAAAAAAALPSRFVGAEISGETDADARAAPAERDD